MKNLVLFSVCVFCVAALDASEKETIRSEIGAAFRLAERVTEIDGADRNEIESHLGDLRNISRRLDDGTLSAMNETDRQSALLEVRRIKRNIAFANPLLQSIDKLLFVKRHDPEKNGTQTFHMCDQFYGFTNIHSANKPGGGIFVLENPFGKEPTLKNLLENVTVAEGKMKGRRLEPGAFVSPEVSFDGKTVYFAYTEARRSDPVWLEEKSVSYYHEWSETTAFHIFRFDIGENRLVQLTDGPVNDFDPCELPDGRIAFVSERRGGFLRCGRYCPVYTLFSMNPDGGNIVCLSYHETHEWQPSMSHEGMILYTRWDYVDRDTNVAHHLWTCLPDGRDPRSSHGNYPVKREARPWMEMDIRAIPGSPKYVATAAAHHGFAFGSLVLIDPRLEDDNAMSQLARLTPEVPFPEAEAKPEAKYMTYGTPWPLGEDDFLCVYGPDCETNPEGVNRGIYWIDAYGNRECVYRDPEISCLSPMPLASRPKPPVIPIQTANRGVPGPSLSQETGTVAVMNVYETDTPFPEGTEIKQLRIVQLLPKTTPTPNVPRIGRAEQSNARSVLGTVPVEPDGSVHFEAPVGVPIYFQALGPDGRAVQSMRSVTYLHPGEQLTCHGCHENKHRTPPILSGRGTALRRPPSRIESEPEGSRPFNYVRLVQPVLDKHCVRCHGDATSTEEKTLHKFDLRGAPGKKHGWTRSYETLTEKHAFYFNVSNGSIRQKISGGSRTVPGRFGAAAARLSPYLEPSHYEVRLTPEERRRIDLWLDANSEFYGSYENVEDQSLGKIVWPTLE